MREIKFRTWDQTTGTMIQDYVHTGQFGELYVTEFHRSAYGAKGCPDLVLMQYTGLKDKNCKDIYDGDILKKDNNALAQIIFKNGCFMGEFVSHDSDLFYFAKDRQHTDWFEIIGNIYENPEMVKK